MLEPKATHTGALPGTVQLTGERHDSGDEFFFTGDNNSAWMFSAGAFRLGVRWQP